MTAINQLDIKIVHLGAFYSSFRNGKPCAKLLFINRKGNLIQMLFLNLFVSFVIRFVLVRLNSTLNHYY